MSTQLIVVTRRAVAAALLLAAWKPSLAATGSPEGDAADFDVSAVSWDQCVDCGDGASPECGCGVAVGAAQIKLTGDWGAATGLAAKGVTRNIDSTNFYFGNTSGGLRRDFQYGAHNDYVFNIDMGKLAHVPGQFWKLRAEHNFGNSINGDTGALVPATVLTDIPVRGSEHVYITNLLLTQALSEQFVMFAGKLDTLDGDTTAFASGRGKTQFSNMGLVANLAPLVMFPYSSLGAGFSVLREMQPIYTFTVINSTDTTRTSGFDELFNDGATLISFLRLPTEFFERPGHQGFGASWSSKNFTSLGQDPRVILPNVPLARQSDSWSLFWNCDQYLFVNPANPQQGWGYFARAGIADDQTSAVEYFLSAGLGGASPIASRPADTWGFGWYHVGLSDQVGPIIQTVFGPIGDGDGVEMFYNAAVTPWCHVTPDVQVIMPGREVVDTALVVGVRANIEF